MQKDGCKTVTRDFRDVPQTSFGRVYTREGAQALAQCFFNPNRYDLAKVGVYKLNKNSRSHNVSSVTSPPNIIADDGEVSFSPTKLSRERRRRPFSRRVSVDVFPIHRMGDTVTQFDHRLISSAMSASITIFSTLRQLTFSTISTLKSSV